MNIDNIKNLRNTLLNIDNTQLQNLKDLIEKYESMFNKYCPFKVGEKVVLTETPEITDTVRWGWRGYKHLLIKGAIATIKSCDYSVEKGFGFYISFKEGGEFYFSAKWLKKVKNVPNSK